MKRGSIIVLLIVISVSMMALAFGQEGISLFDQSNSLSSMKAWKGYWIYMYGDGTWVI
jgi:hypothetical protein